jgi:hypothetical protein
MSMSRTHAACFLRTKLCVSKFNSIQFDRFPDVTSARQFIDSLHRRIHSFSSSWVKKPRRELCFVVVRMQCNSSMGSALVAVLGPPTACYVPSKEGGHPYVVLSCSFVRWQTPLARKKESRLTGGIHQFISSRRRSPLCSCRRDHFRPSSLRRCPEEDYFRRADWGARYREVHMIQHILCCDMQGLIYELNAVTGAQSRGNKSNYA